MEGKKTSLFSHHALNDKERKNLVILDLIRKKGPISRIEISKLTGINNASISFYIKDYAGSGLVRDKGHDVSSGGRPPELVEFNPKASYVIGIDVSQASPVGVLSDLGLNVMTKSRIQFEKNNPLPISEIAPKLINKLIDDSKIEKSKIRFVGLGISCEGSYVLRDEIEKVVGITTLAGSDASCAAFAEKRINPEADVENLLYMYSDLGCGIIMQGDIYFGSGGLAGEMRTFNECLAKEEDGVPVKETYYLRPWCADLSIVENARKEIARGIGTKMVALANGDIKNVTKHIVIEAAGQNDEVALDIIKSVAVNLGVRTAYLVNIFDPEAVVIGGGVEKGGGLIMEPIRQEIKKFVLNKQADTVKIIPSTLGEDAVALGAAALAVREVFIRA